MAQRKKTPDRQKKKKKLGSVHVEFLVDKVAQGQVFLQVLLFTPVNFIPSVRH
jgi:hypothetical protein